MSDSEDRLEDAAPKRRGRRPKPASLDKPGPLAAELAASEKPVKRGPGRPKRKAATEDAPVEIRETPPPSRERDEPIPQSFSASPDDMNEPAPRAAEPESRQSDAPASPDGGQPQGNGPEQPGPRSEGPSGGNVPRHPQQGNYRGDRPPAYGYGNQGGQGGGGRQWEKPWKRDKFGRGDFKKGKFGKQYPPQGGGGGYNAPAYNPPNKPVSYNKPPAKPYGGFKARVMDSDAGSLQMGELPMWEPLKQIEEIDRMAAEATGQGGQPLDFNHLYSLNLSELEETMHQAELNVPAVPLRRQLIRDLLRDARAHERPIRLCGVLDLFDDENGMLAYSVDNYRLRGLSCYVPQRLIERWGLRRGHQVEVWAHPPRDGESCPYALKVISVNERPPEDVAHITPFTELVPYYPTERFLMETKADAKWDNNSMRVVDLLTPVGLGQRGLIVAAPRTGKTVLMQGMANAIRENRPDVHMIILLVDERPEEVTDFRRTVMGAEVISSTFDEPAESHVHAAEMVIEKARRMIEYGKHVVILLDSITRLARAYNTLMPSSGKILSGGVESNALQKPKRFFGSARNIEGAGSLTILGTALIETGSKMDEVIFEEFKGTGNMELHLDRALSDKRIFPSLNFEKSGTRKEELLYHPDELQKIYSLRRAMKGIPSTEAMEMLIQRVKKTKSNAEFLISLNR
jgi:transcription termination factor Rho